MQFKQLFDDDRAVSPVIGVILMVAITVILAAVIGSFVLGLGNSVQQTAPNANFQFDVDSSSTLTVTHSGGDSIDENRLAVNVGGTEYEGFATTEADSATNTYDSSTLTSDAEDVSAGDSVSISSVGSDVDVSVIWTSEDGGTSQTLASYTTA